MYPPCRTEIVSETAGVLWSSIPAQVLAPGVSRRGHRLLHAAGGNFHSIAEDL
jgi:hypothetical protein